MTAINEIQSEAMRLASVEIASAIEGGDWVALSRLSERMADLAYRGLYHSQKLRQQDIAKFAMGAHTESEIR